MAFKAVYYIDPAYSQSSSYTVPFTFPCSSTMTFITIPEPTILFLPYGLWKRCSRLTMVPFPHVCHSLLVHPILFPSQHSLLSGCLWLIDYFLSPPSGIQKQGLNASCIPPTQNETCPAGGTKQTYIKWENESDSLCQVNFGPNKNAISHLSAFPIAFSFH